MFAPFAMMQGSPGGAGNTHSINLARASEQNVWFSDGANDITGSFTVSTWLRFTALPSTAERFWIFSKANINASVLDYFFEVFDSGGDPVVRARAAQADGTFQVRTWNIAGLVSEGVWFHLHLTLDTSAAVAGDLMELWIDGDSQGSGVGTGVISDVRASNETVTIGDLSEDATGNYHFDGDIDDFRVFAAVVDYATYDTESELNGDEPNLWLYCKFNDNLDDDGPNAFSLTGSNSPTFSEDTGF